MFLYVICLNRMFGRSQYIMRQLINYNLDEMSLAATGPEAHDSLFERPQPTVASSNEQVPPNLERATLRLQYPPTYVIVGVYRLLTDKALYVPAWDKCKHATRRGAIVGVIWVRILFLFDEQGV